MSKDTLPRIDTHRIMTDIAGNLSKESKCNKIKVGAIIVKNRRIISSGVNGSLKGYNNICEEEVIKCSNCDRLNNIKLFKIREDMNNMLFYKCECGVKLNFDKNVFNENIILKTLPHIIHAEENAILFAAKNGINIDGSSIYVTHLPCMTCARMIIGSGIKEVFYKYTYKQTDSINLFKSNNVKIVHIKD